MIWVRGAPADFDTWAYLGADGWSWDDVRPVYERIEPELDLLTSFEPDAIHIAIAEAAQECGIPLNADYNGASQDGVSFMQYSIEDGVRHSTAAAYSDPSRRARTSSSSPGGRAATAVRGHTLRRRRMVA